MVSTANYRGILDRKNGRLCATTNEYCPIFQQPYNIGTTIWSPLKSGLITGKYNDGIPEDSRMNQKGYEWLQKRLESFQKDGSIDKVRSLTIYAKEKFGCSVAQLALAWCLKNKNVTTVLLGATKVSQLEENLGSLAIAKQMKGEHLKEIEEILGNKPDSWGGPNGSGPRTLETLE